MRRLATTVAKLGILLVNAPTVQFVTCAIYLVMLLESAPRDEFWMITGVEDLSMKGVEGLVRLFVGHVTSQGIPVGSALQLSSATTVVAVDMWHMNAPLVV